MPALPQSNIHLDILMGRDESIDTADFMGGKLLPSSLVVVYSSDRLSCRYSGRSDYGHSRGYGEEDSDVNFKNVVIYCILSQGNSIRVYQIQKWSILPGLAFDVKPLARKDTLSNKARTYHTSFQQRDTHICVRPTYPYTWASRIAPKNARALCAPKSSGCLSSTFPPPTGGGHFLTESRPRCLG
jgi:hypothetical protein